MRSGSEDKNEHTETVELRSDGWYFKSEIYEHWIGPYKFRTTATLYYLADKERSEQYNKLKKREKEL